MKVTYLTPTDINEFLYCQVQFYLHKVLGYYPKKNKNMQFGFQKHAALYEESLKEELPFTFEEGLPKAFAGEVQPFSVREFDLLSEKYKLKGRVDEIHVEKNLVRVIDDKKSDKVYSSYKMQVYAYALAFQDIYGPYPTEVVIRNLDSGNEMWKTKFTSDKKREIKELLDTMWDVVNREKKPIPSSGYKCEKCGLNYICDFYKRRKGI